MKAMAWVPAVAAAILALSMSAASSQQACVKVYQACMDGCINKPTKTVQNSCFQSCEGKNEMCGERIYGKRPANAAPPAAEARDTSKNAPKDGPKVAPVTAPAKAERQAADARDQADPKQMPKAPQPQQQPAPARR